MLAVDDSGKVTGSATNQERVIDLADVRPTVDAAAAAQTASEQVDRGGEVGTRLWPCTPTASPAWRGSPA